MELLLVFGLELGLDLRERALFVVPDVFDAQTGLARPLSVLLERAQLEQVVEHVLALARRGVDQLVHLPLPDVRAVDKIILVHPEQFGHPVAHVPGTLVGRVGALQNALDSRGPLVAHPHPPPDVVAPAGVREPQLDGRLLGADGDDLVEGPLQRLRAVEREKAGLKQRGFAAAIQTVDDGHAGLQPEVGLLEAFEGLQADPVEPHR